MNIVKDEIKEVFKPVFGYEGVYEFSNFGNLRSKSATRGNRWKLKKETVFPSGYQGFCLSYENRREMKYTHQLFWEYEYDMPIPAGHCIDHISGDRSNNDISNLRLTTHGGNMRGARKKSEGTSSKYRGVSWQSGSQRWRAMIGYKGKYYYAGLHKSEEAAARAWNKRAKALGFYDEALNKVGGEIL